MNIRRQSFLNRNAHRGGFTLVEMLVAVALVSLMMSLFAGVFQIASATMAKQKGISENDQRARTLVTILRSDLKYRTFTLLAPFGATTAAPNNTATPLDTDDTSRKGYFYISENDPNNDADDVLQFTVFLDNAPDPYFYGRAVALADGMGTTTLPNQPEYDDGRADANNAGHSQRAEVSYFLRNGVLYRRVMLIRDTSDGSPRDASNTPLVTTAYEAGGATKNFWSDFDYSANFDMVASKPQFHGISTLTNTSGSIPSVSNFPSLGIPHYRWGHNHATGLPREFINSGSTFIGRFLQQETSDPNFGYPARITPGSPNPMDPGTTGTLTLNANGVVTTYANGTRVVDDMLLPNVHAFDIKVWDPAADSGPDGQPGKAGVNDDVNGPDGISGNGDDDATTDNNSELGWPGSDDGKFVDVGHSGATGFYTAAANGNTTYCPAGHCRFDTWNFSPDLAPPPYRPVLPTVAGGTVQALKAIQIKIRFYDVTSGQLKEVTLVQSLTN